jgi:hypothetical protein
MRNLNGSFHLSASRRLLNNDFSPLIMVEMLFFLVSFICSSPI